VLPRSGLGQLVLAPSPVYPALLSQTIALNVRMLCTEITELSVYLSFDFNKSD
jgi:hypothetical protein